MSSPKLLINDSQSPYPYINVSQEGGARLYAGNIGPFKGYAVIEFTEKHFQHGRITANCRKKIQDYFKNTLIGFDRTDKLTDHEMFATLLKLSTIISAKKKEAEKLGKPLLILIGENHSSREALILEYMIIAIASDLGISNLLLETDDRSKPLFEKFAKRLRSYNFNAQIHSENIKYYILFAALNNMKMISVDPNYSFTSAASLPDFQCCPKRMEGINDEILKINQNAVGIFGTFHSSHIVDKVMEDKYCILNLILGENRNAIPNAVYLRFSGTPYTLDFLELQQKIMNFQRAARLVFCAINAGIYPSRLCLN